MARSWSVEGTITRLISPMRLFVCVIGVLPGRGGLTGTTGPRRETHRTDGSGGVAAALASGLRLPRLDAAGAAAVGEEADRPTHEHERPVLEPDQVGKVDAQPQ